MSERLDRKHDQLGHEREVRRERRGSDPEDAVDDPVGDDVLRLMFMCCHPLLSREARVALTLRLPDGLTTKEIARAFLVPVPTLAERIVRAKRTLREARVPFEVPSGDELDERLDSVLEVIYLVFNEGYAASGRCFCGGPPRPTRDRDVERKASGLRSVPRGTIGRGDSAG